MKLPSKTIAYILIITIYIISFNSIFTAPKIVKAQSFAEISTTVLKGGLLVDYCTNGGVGRTIAGTLQNVGRGLQDFFTCDADGGERTTFFGETSGGEEAGNSDLPTDIFVVESLGDCGSNIIGRAADFVHDFVTNNPTLQDIITNPLVTSFVGPLIGSLFGGGDSVQAVKDEELRRKELCYDALAQIAAQKILSQLNDKTLAWLQQGLNGNPFFVEDYLKYQAFKIDERLRNYILNNDTFQSVCDAFKSDVALSLQAHYYRQYATPNTTTADGIPVRYRNTTERIVTTNNQYKCGLEQAIEANRGNTARFLEGYFMEGDWRAWNEIQKDNPFRAYIGKTIEVAQIAGDIAAEVQNDIRTGNGFLPDRRCSQKAELSQIGVGFTGTVNTYNPSGSGTATTSVAAKFVWLNKETLTPLRVALNTRGTPYQGTSNERPEPAPCLQESIVTPAKVINAMAEQIITGDVRRSELADEMNEVLLSIDKLLFNKVGVFGLRNTEPGSVIDGKSVAETERALLHAEVSGLLGYETQFRDAVADAYEAAHVGIDSEMINFSNLEGSYQPTFDPDENSGELPAGSEPIFTSISTPSLLSVVSQCRERAGGSPLEDLKKAATNALYNRYQQYDLIERLNELRIYLEYLRGREDLTLDTIVKLQGNGLTLDPQTIQELDRRNLNLENGKIEGLESIRSRYSDADLPNVSEQINNIFTGDTTDNITFELGVFHDFYDVRDARSLLYHIASNIYELYQWAERNNCGPIESKGGAAAEIKSFTSSIGSVFKIPDSLLEDDIETQAVTLSWESTGVRTCRGTSNPILPTWNNTSKQLSGNETINLDVRQPITFTLQCIAANNFVATKSVSIAPSPYKDPGEADSITIELEGEDTVYVKQGEPYQEEGYSLIVNNIQVLGPQEERPTVTIEANEGYGLEDDLIMTIEQIAPVLNTNITGTYFIDYKGRQNGQVVTTKRRTVVVNNSGEKEVTLQFSLYGDAVMNIDRGSNTYTEPGYIATRDMVWKEIEYKNGGAVNITSSDYEVVVEGSVNSSKIGTYNILYSLFDSRTDKQIGQTLVRTVHVGNLQE